MAISNLQEKLLFFTKQKSLLTFQVSNLQMTILGVTQKELELQQDYNKELQGLYFEYHDTEPEVYTELLMQMNDQREFELASLTAWENQLDLKKENLENQLNEVSTFETSYQKLLQTNLKRDFTYGGGK